MAIRTLVVCPGRGAYDREGLGQLQGRSAAAQKVVDACDGWRMEHGRPPVSELDAAPTFRGKLHVAGEHASLLTFACTLADLAELDRERFQVVGVVGNSMGFYTALAASGALPLPHAIRLVDTMGAYQQDRVIGGQLIYPVLDDRWQPLPERRAAITRALNEGRKDGLHVYESIRLGSHAVLAGDESGLAYLSKTLPPVEKSGRVFPVRLPLHSAFHTPLMQKTSRQAMQDLADLDFRPPDVPLVDGRGVVFRPRWAAPRDLASYTLDTQVVEPFDFELAVRTALAHCGPDLVLALGPGNSLGMALASTIVREGWRGVRNRDDLQALRQRETPALLSMGLSQDRAWL